MSEVTHVPFNPIPLGHNDSPISRVCGDWGRGGWALLRVVPVSQFEAVAVFERAIHKESDVA